MPTILTILRYGWVSLSGSGAGRAALVTGASRGIGRAIARALAARGVRIGLHYHANDAAAEATRAQLNGDGHLLCKADLTDAAATVRLWLAPGFISTDMAASVLEGPAGTDILAQHPLGRIATPEEIARAAVFCALDAPAAVTGSIIDLNGARYSRP